MPKGKSTYKRIVSEEVGKYETHPFFVKKAAESAAILEDIDFPSDITSKKSQRPVGLTRVFVSSTVSAGTWQKAWTVTVQGRSKPARVTATQKEAIEVARAIARNKRAEVIIFGRDGQIRDRNLYGVDKPLSRFKRTKH